MLNVSYGGCFLRTSIPFPPGETVSLAFQTPMDMAVLVEAKVVWNVTPLDKASMPPGMGLKFISFQRGEDVMKAWLAK
jgi:Tfp pilus assembly protein PilZ